MVGGHDGAAHGDGRAHAEGLHLGEVLDIAVVNHLRVLEAGAVEKVDEAHALLLAVVADPALQADPLTLQLGQAFLQLSGGDDVHGCISSRAERRL